MGIKIEQERRAKLAFTNDQIKIIQQTLEKSCVDKICLSKLKLYDALKHHLVLEMEQYQFDQAISNALRTGQIQGFETRTGKHGGICRKGVFAAHDATRKRKRSCSVYIESRHFSLSVHEKTIINLLLKLGGSKHQNGNIKINDVHYKLPDNINTARLLEALASAVWK